MSAAPLSNLQSPSQARTFADTERELDRAIEELRGQAPQEPASAPGMVQKKSVTMQIPVEVNIVLGSAEMSVGELAGLQQGSTIQLDRRVGEPVDVVVNGVKIARGEIMLLENDANRFGFRITEIVG